jgi:hypothetical protein
MLKRIFTPEEIKKQNSNKYIGRKKKYRKAHKDLRNKSRKDNYSKSKPIKRTNRPWTDHDIWMLGCRVPDFILAKSLNRSVQAIQQKRYLLNKESYENIKTKN